jgi:hypothetical protein
VKRALALPTVISLGLVSVALAAFVLGVRQVWVPGLTVTATLLNALLLLVYFRLITYHSSLSQKKKDLWVIIVFAGGPYTQLLYLLRFHRPK